MNLDPARAYERSRRGRRPSSRCISSAGRSTGRSCRTPCRRTSIWSRTRPARSGARWRGMPCGGLGELGCLSFHPRKIVSTGEGGAVTTNDGELADAVRSARHHADLDRRRLRHPRARLQLPPLGRAVRDRARPARAGWRSCGRRATGWRRRTPSAWPGSSETPGAGRRATGTAGRPTSSSSTGATGRSTRCARQGIEAPDRHVRRPPAHRLRRPGAVPRRRPCFERALALPLPLTAHGVGSRPGRRSP